MSVRIAQVQTTYDVVYEGINYSVISTHDYNTDNFDEVVMFEEGEPIKGKEEEDVLYYLHERI